MKKFILVIYVVLLFTSCGKPQDIEKIEVPLTDEQIQQKIALDKLIKKTYKDYVFEMNIRCGETDINKDITEFIQVSEEIYDIEEIFWAASEGSCIGIINIKGDKGIAIWLYNIRDKHWFLNKQYDTDGTCGYGNTSNNQTFTCLEKEKEFNSRIEKLRK